MTLLSLLDLERARHPGRSDAMHIQRIAQDAIDELGIHEPPVNVDMLASLLGVGQVVSDDGLDAAGCLICDGDVVEIWVRAADRWERQRFTICHECAHTFFPGFALQPRYRCAPEPSADDDRQLEALCDQAASELLLPRKLFKRDLSDAGFSLDAVDGLSDLYEASFEATAYRVVSLWPDDAALLTFENVQKPSERDTHAPEKLRLVKCFTRGDWPFFRRHKSVSGESGFGRAWDGELVNETAVITDVCREPIEVEMHARRTHYSAAGRRNDRVLALVRRTAHAG